MPNPLFNALGGNMQPAASGPNQMIQQLVQFRNNFQGDARQEVMKLVQSGSISQAQLNQLQAQARQIQRLLNTNK